MLRTQGSLIPQIEGMDQQDFDQLQLVQGAFPYQIGLQKRVPGKTLINQQEGRVSALYVFYLVHGRHYELIDYGGGNISIIPVVVPPIVLPGLPPTDNFWFDTFSGYEVGLISKLWGAGIWPIGIGICETIIQGIFDPFLVYANVPTAENGDNDDKPKPLPPPPDDPGIPPAAPGSPGYMYPPGMVDVVLIRTTATADNSCTGQGTQPVAANDIVRFYDYSGGPELDSITALAVTIGDVVVWHGKKIGRSDNVDIGLVEGTCPGPPHPTPTEYSIYANTGELSQDS